MTAGGVGADVKRGRECIIRLTLGQEPRHGRLLSREPETCADLLLDEQRRCRTLDCHEDCYAGLKGVLAQMAPPHPILRSSSTKDTAHRNSGHTVRPAERRNVIRHLPDFRVEASALRFGANERFE